MPLAFQSADLLQLELEQDHGVLEEGAEHEDDAGDDPALDGGQSLGLNMREYGDYFVIHGKFVRTALLLLLV